MKPFVKLYHVVAYSHGHKPMPIWTGDSRTAARECRKAAQDAAGPDFTYLIEVEYQLR